MAEGWVKLSRQLTEHWLWKRFPFSYGQAWVDLILIANHEDVKIPYKGKMIICKKGTVNRSISSLAERWKWSRDKTRRFLDLLEADGMCVVNATTNRTTITLVNYESFQVSPSTNSTTNDTTDKATSRQRVDTNKNDKNDKNILPKGNRATFSPPTLDEVRDYCNERNNNVVPEKFINFYESKGWMVGKNKMKDWKAAVRNWEGGVRKNGGNNNTEVPSMYGPPIQLWD